MVKINTIHIFDGDSIQVIGQLEDENINKIFESNTLTSYNDLIIHIKSLKPEEIDEVGDFHRITIIDEYTIQYIQKTLENNFSIEWSNLDKTIYDNFIEDILDNVIFFQ